MFAVALLAGGLPPAGRAAAAPPPQADPAAVLLNAMTPAERVGQLFVVSFYGASADKGS